MCEALSSDHLSTDQQIMDVVDHLRYAMKALEGHEVAYRKTEYDRFHEAFPEFSHLKFGMSYIDTEASGVDLDYMHWALDWLENNVSGVGWVDGEPYEICDEQCVLEQFFESQ